MRDSWYLRRAGVESGPVSFHTLTEWAHSGRIAPDDELRRSDQQVWQSAADVEGLFDSTAQGDAGDDDMFGDILSSAATDDGGHVSGERVGQRLEEQVGFDPHHLSTQHETPRFFCRVQGKESGPFSIDELQQRADAGQLSPFDRVRNESGKAWVPAREIAELRFPAAAALNTRAAPVAETSAHKQPFQSPSSPEPPIETLIDDVLSENESRPSRRPVSTPAHADRPPSHVSRPAAAMASTSRESPPVAAARPQADEPKQPRAPSPAPASASGTSRVKTSLPRRKRSLSLPSLPSFSLPNMEFRMPGGKLFAALVGVLLLAAIVWWMRRPSDPGFSGEVTIDKQPVPEGTISFTPMTGTQGELFTLAIVEGKFEAGPDDVLGSGPHRVRVLIGNPLGPPPPSIASVPALVPLNGATFEKEIDTTSDAEDLLIFDFAAADARIRESAPGSVVRPD